MQKIFIILLGAIFSYAVEPSVFGAGDLNSPNPYGLTSSEKIILKNKKEVKTLSTNIGFVKSELSNMQEKIDGIRSVVESQNSRIAKMSKQISLLQDNDNNITNKINNIKNDLNITKENQIQNYKKIKMVLSELSSLIDSINSSYVSKDEFNKKFALLESKINKIDSISLRNRLSKISAKTIFKRAKKYFDDKKYEQAKIYFKESIKRRHLPATSSFYLGEISFVSKDYPNAINYYKKSISLYSKTASFTPTLLFHAYLSFKKLGDNKNAKKFKKILLLKYPKSKEAKKLKKL